MLMSVQILRGHQTETPGGAARNNPSTRSLMEVIDEGHSHH
jgi:hypothetical protein